MRSWCLLLLCGGAAFAQFHNLATTEDGGLLVFSSALRMRGTDQLPYDKLFAIDANGLRLYMQRDKVGPNPDDNPPVTNPYQLEGADFSGDGAVRVVIGQLDCYRGSGCVPVSKIHSEIYGLGGTEPRVLYGWVRISRNGRYAVTCCDSISPPPPRMLIDLTTGRSKVLAGAAPDLYARRIVSSTGKVVAAGGKGLYLQDFDGVVEFPTSAVPVKAAIDDAATTVVYSSGKLLARVSLASGAETTLATAEDIKLVGLTSNGRVVTYLSGQQLYVVDGTAAARQLTHDPAGILDATASGNGAVAFAATAAGRILKIDINTGATTELIGRLATLTNPDPNSPPFPVAGSAFCVNGIGLVDTPASAAPPLPTSLGGVEILLDGKAVPLLSVAPGAACFQVPWETTLGTHTLAPSSPAASPFIQETQFEMPYGAFVNPVYRDGLYPLAAHGDWSALVTPGNPARPGEILHFYMTGLGAVTPSVATGEPAPAVPPASATAQPVCTLSNAGADRVPVEVLFASLAPGYTGYYQLSVRLPATLPATALAEFRCWSGEEWAGSVGILPVATQ